MAFRLFFVSAMILMCVGTTAFATYTVSVPDYPTLSQLESGWNDAFVSWLTGQYGGSPVITSTTTYTNQDGEILVMSSFVAGSVSGNILGRAFDPQDATSLGGGNYMYAVAADGGFTCAPAANCSLCEPHEKHNSDGSYERWCDCPHPEGNGGCTLTPLGDLVGSYNIDPSDYGSLPNLD